MLLFSLKLWTNDNFASLLIMSQTSLLNHKVTRFEILSSFHFDFTLTCQWFINSVGLWLGACVTIWSKHFFIQIVVDTAFPWSCQDFGFIFLLFKVCDPPAYYQNKSKHSAQEAILIISLYYLSAVHFDITDHMLLNEVLMLRLLFTEGLRFFLRL